jgi:hypothetical protein
MDADEAVHDGSLTANTRKSICNPQSNWEIVVATSVKNLDENGDDCTL